MTSIILNLSKIGLWTCGMWHIFNSVPCILGRNVYSTVVGWNVPRVPVRSSWCRVMFKSSVSCWSSAWLFDPLLEAGHWSLQLILLTFALSAQPLLSQDSLSHCDHNSHGDSNRASSDHVYKCCQVLLATHRLWEIRSKHSNPDWSS